jgi:uncharacterized membrane protein (UPF0127 family)
MEQTDKKVLNKSILVLLVVVAIFVLLLLVAGKKGTNMPSVAETMNTKQAIVSIGGQNLVASVADTPLARSRGLSGTTSLNNKNGMLFKFEQADEHGIWMKDMTVPIDIIWIDEQNRVVSIEDNVSPSTYPKVFKPDMPAKYVLEVTAGYVLANNIKLGDTVISTPVIQ